MPTQMSGDDAEKGTVGLGITTSASASTSSSPAHVTSAPSPLRSLFSVGHVSLRRRRLLGMVVFTLGVITLGGWWSESIPDLRGILFGSESPVAGLPSDSGWDISLPILGHAQPKAWGTDIPVDALLNGLPPWPSNPPIDESTTPLSPLGHFADNLYNLGPTTLPDYAASLDIFAESTFPNIVAERLKAGLAVFLGGVDGRTSWDIEKNIWQIDKDRSKDGNMQVRSWSNGLATDERWKWELMTDDDADQWIRERLGGSMMESLWNILPRGILRSDTLRYLLVLLEGGIYSDTDTRLLRRPSAWGEGAILWKDGQGWLQNDEKVKIASGQGWEDVLGPPSVVVGIEADVGGRADWFDWWPRPLQLVQWTFASTPNHPIPLSATLRILHSTSKAIRWSHSRASKLERLKAELAAGDGSMEDREALEESIKKLEGTAVTATLKDGGPVGIMDWTGPGVWTDAVLSYLKVKYGLVWTDLRNLRVPLRVGDVVILPVTGFSPGVGNFGSQHPTHPQAMVEHLFAGSWKSDGDPR